MPQEIVENSNYRYPVTVIKETMDTQAAGNAGVRLRMDEMLLAHHGHSEEEWKQLNEAERAMLLKIAREGDPTFGVSHQAAAITALGAIQERPAQLLLSEIARNRQQDMRLRVSATFALGRMGEADARQVLRGLLAAKEPEVRLEAMRGLVKSGTAEDVHAIELLAEKDKTFVGELAGESAAALRLRLRIGD